MLYGFNVSYVCNIVSELSEIALTVHGNFDVEHENSTLCMLKADGFVIVGLGFESIGLGYWPALSASVFLDNN